MQEPGQSKSPDGAAATTASDQNNATLLRDSDAPAVTILRAEAASPFVLVSDHAGRSIPAVLGDLGLPESERMRHIAWDIGVAGTGLLLSEALCAPLVAQTYSRLVIDCNRKPGHPTSVAPTSDLTAVPGNQDLTEAQRALRERQIFAPYHAAIAELLDRRLASGLESVLVALHSFTPRLRSASRPGGGNAAGERPWHVGVLFNRDPRFALILGGLLREEQGLVVGDNQPYFLSDADDYTVPVHGERRTLPHVEIEIRQDLIGDGAGEAEWAARLARLLPEAWRRYRDTVPC